MALGKIKADTLEHSTAGTVDTQYVVNGSAKVTIAADEDAVLFKSLNVSSGVDEGTGDYTYNLTNALTTNTAENPTATCALGYQTIIRVKTADATTSVVDVESINTSASATNADQGIAVFGDLA